VRQRLIILLDWCWIRRESPSRAGTATALTAAAAPTGTPATLTAAARLATTALATAAGLPAASAGATTWVRGAGRNAIRGVADQFSVCCSEGEESHEHYQGDHGDQERILRNVVPGLLAPKTL
jgi:hypothetical protein